jgi:hypothetical protein
MTMQVDTSARERAEELPSTDSNPLMETFGLRAMLSIGAGVTADVTSRTLAVQARSAG